LLLKCVVDGERNLAAKREREAVADAKVWFVFERRGGRCIVDADLDARGVGERFAGTAAGVAYLADGNGRVAKVEFAVLDLEVVFVGRDVLVDAEFRLGSAVVLDLDFEVERWDTFQCDGNDFFATLGVAGAVAIRLARIVEVRIRKIVNRLLNGDGGEMLTRVVVFAVGQLNKFVVISARLGCFGANGRDAAECSKILLPERGCLAILLVLGMLLVLDVKWRVSWRR
jgi:hypothetical protein